MAYGLPCWVFRGLVIGVFCSPVPEGRAQSSGIEGEAWSYQYSFGGSGEVHLTNPRGIDVDQVGNIYVADAGSHRVLKFGPDGKLIHYVGGYGWGIEQFDRPVDVWASSGLDVYVVDQNNHRIQRYDKDLHFIAELASERLPPNFRIEYPTSAVLSTQGEFFLTDGENARVLKLDAEGIPELFLGGFGELEGALASPGKIEISPDGHVYVCDRGRDRVVVYDTFGNYLRTVGAGLLRGPSGIDFGADGTFYILDAGNGRVVQFTPDGGLLGTLSFAETPAVVVRESVDIAVHQRRLFLLDAGSALVHLFERGGSGRLR